MTLGVGIGDPVRWEYGFVGEPTDTRQPASRLDEGLAVLDGLTSGTDSARDTDTVGGPPRV